MSAQFMGIFTVGQTIDRGIKLYKMALPRMFILLMVPMLLASTPIMMSMAAGGTHSSLGAFGILSFVGLLVNVWAYIVLVRYVYALSEGKTFGSFGEILKLASAKDFIFIVTCIIWFVALTVGFLLLLIPGIYLSILAMMLAYPVCIIERRYFFDGIGRVMALGKKRWWKTCAIGAVTMLIVMVPIAIAYLVLMLFMVKSIAAGAGAGDPESVTKAGFSFGALIGTVLYAAVSALVTPLWPTVAIVHYNSLRSEKESSDIAGQLDALAAPKA